MQLTCFAMMVLAAAAIFLAFRRAIYTAVFCGAVLFAVATVEFDGRTPGGCTGPLPEAVPHGAAVTRVELAPGLTATVFDNNVVWLGGE